jgi:hypothetical protein
MIAFDLEGKEGKILGLGFNELDLEALKQGKPLLKEVGKYKESPIDKVLIMYGKTDFSILNDLKKEGIVGPNTKIHSKGFLV